MARPASVPGEAPPSEQALQPVAPLPPAPAAEPQPPDPVAENLLLREQVQTQAIALEQMRDQMGQFKALVEALAAKKAAEAAPAAPLPTRAEAEKMLAEQARTTEKPKAILSQDGYVMPPSPRVVPPVARA